MSILTKETLEAGLREAACIAEGFKPGEAELADAPLLIDWTVEPLFDSLVRLVGRVRGHPLIPDGWIATSPLPAADERAGWTRTVSRYYRLGLRLGKTVQ